MQLNAPEIALHQLMDVNFVPGNPRGGNRNNSADNPRGVKDWTHVNAISYNPVLDQIMLSYNTASELNIIDHSTTTEEAKGHTGGRYGKGGDFLYRFGNPATMRGDLLQKQSLFVQHNIHWIPDGSNPCYDAVPGGAEGHILLFNNGRVPDRHWTTVDEFKLPTAPASKGGYERAPTDGSQGWDEGGFKKAEHIWVNPLVLCDLTTMPLCFVCDVIDDRLLLFFRRSGRKRTTTAASTALISPACNASRMAIRLSPWVRKVSCLR